MNLLELQSNLSLIGGAGDARKIRAIRFYPVVCSASVSIAFTCIVSMKVITYINVL